jgi:LPXTG-motif cell wall-anchored protein
VTPPIVLPDVQDRPDTTILPNRILPFTGTDPLLLVAVAGVLMGIGGVLLVVGRRREELRRA